jgi:hypothetical protein
MHVGACVRDMGEKYVPIFIGKSDHLRDMGLCGRISNCVDWIQLAEGRVQSCAVPNMVRNVRIT